MLNFFKFGGIDSRDYGIFIISSNSFDSPKRKTTAYSIPGRDGDIIVDEGYYLNVDITYKVRISIDKLLANNPNTNIAYALDGIKDCFYSIIGEYAELRDSYNPDYYRMGCFDNGFEFSEFKNNKDFIDTEITFNCKPHRYREDGKEVIAINNNTTNRIYNPEIYASLPLIQINKGTGDHASVIIDGTSFQFDFSNQSDFPGQSIPTINIDSENQLVYYLGTNYYSKYSPPQSQKFPVLKSGTSIIQKTVETGTVLITPRWRRI